MTNYTLMMLPFPTLHQCLNVVFSFCETNVYLLLLAVSKCNFNII